MTTDQSELLALLLSKKESTMAWIAEDPDNRFAGYPVTDLDHWVGYGITTVAEYNRYALETDVIETYKEVRGFRPRWLDMKTLTDSDLSNMLDALVQESKTVLAEQEKADAAAIEEFEKSLALIIKVGAKSRENAISWLCHNETPAMVERANDLPYGYLTRKI